MKRFKQKKIPLKWLWIWLVQIASMLVISVPCAYSILLGSVVHGVFQWGIMPAAGFVSACLATRKGLLNYAAWIAPMAMMPIGNLMVWGYASGVGPAFLCGFVSLVGAATGEVMNQQKRKK